MRSIPSAKTFLFKTSGVEIEGDDAHGVDFQFEWEPTPRKTHARNMSVAAFFIDRYPITCQEYKAYLEATGFQPADPTNWLKNWDHHAHTTMPDASPPSYPPSLARTPVTYVSLDDARRYCAHAGKRLPHAWEWQLAAQGLDGRPWPWGNVDDTSGYRRPVTQTGVVLPDPIDVDKHSPQGDSPYGVGALVGHVWQYTDEFKDEHTRAVLLRGGSNYRPSGSSWYFPQAQRLDQHNKYMLMGGSYERAGTLGFRCVQDASDDTMQVEYGAWQGAGSADGALTEA